MNKLTEWLTKPLIKEIELPVKVGDVVLMGRFKNKKVVVKSITYNEKGDLLINKRPALKFRLAKQDGKKLLPIKTTDKGSTNPDPDMRGAEFKGIRANKKENVNESKKEFVIWGIPPKKSSEEILYTKAKSNSEAKKVLKILVSKHGVKKGRIQVLDLEQDP